jgi:hypothetical protein
MRLIYTGGDQPGLQAKTRRGQGECHVLSWKLRHLKKIILIVPFVEKNGCITFTGNVEQAFFQKKVILADTAKVVVRRRQSQF